MASMKSVIVLLAEGFEEMEVVLPIDLLRRAGINVDIISMNDSLLVRGSRNIVLEANLLADNITDEYLTQHQIHAVYCPGGMEGSKNLAKHAFTKKVLQKVLEDGGFVASICAACIIVLGSLGLIQGKRFTCYPGMEKLKQHAHEFDASLHTTDEVVHDGNIITSQGPGTAHLLACKLIELLVDKATSEKVRTEALFR